MCTFNKGNTGGTISSKICVLVFVYACFVIGSVDRLEFVYEKSFQMCVCLWRSFFVLR